VPLTDIVNFFINLQQPGLTSPGFGVPLVLSNTGNAWTTPELVRVYTSAAAGLVDFPQTTPEYGALASCFAQSPAPQQVMVGKGTTKPTMTQTISLSSVVAGAQYKINIWSGGTLWSAQYTALAAAAWVALTVYPKGAVVTNDTGKNYICITSGTAAGAGGPSGTTADITDGTVHWMYIGPTGATTYNDGIVYQLVNRITPASRVASTPYLVGDRVTNSGNLYECTVAGTTSAGAGPSGTGAQSLDGTVQWIYVIATPNFAATVTGSVLSKIVTCTGSAAGSWFALEPVASGDPAAVSNLMALLETTTDPGVSTDLGAIAAASSLWYGLVLLHKSPAIVATAVSGVAAWVEANGKLLCVAPVDTVCATAAYAVGGADICNKTKDATYARTTCIYHPRAYEFADAARFGRWLPVQPGSDNWRMKSYAGVTPVGYTGTQIANLQAKNAAFYYALGSISSALNVDGGSGLCASGQFVDVERFIDYLSANIATDFVNLEYGSNKIPFTDPGIALIETIVRKWMSIGITVGGIATSPPPLVVGPHAIDVPAGDKTARWLGKTSGYGISATFTLAGAINKATVTLNVLF
jgi:hypothetical protein